MSTFAFTAVCLIGLGGFVCTLLLLLRALCMTSARADREAASCWREQNDCVAVPRREACRGGAEYVSHRVRRGYRETAR